MSLWDLGDHNKFCNKKCGKSLVPRFGFAQKAMWLLLLAQTVFSKTVYVSNFGAPQTGLLEKSLFFIWFPQTDLLETILFVDVWGITNELS